MRGNVAGRATGRARGPVRFGAVVLVLACGIAPSMPAMDVPARPLAGASSARFGAQKRTCSPVGKAPCAAGPPRAPLPDLHCGVCVQAPALQWACGTGMRLWRA
jgi:hypothetical protein